MASSNTERAKLKKGAWSPEEDQKLIAYIKRYGIWNWNHMAKPAGLARSGKSCRLRWVNYLKPNIKRGNFSKEEEETIITLHAALGNRWSAIAAKLPGRTDNDVKNHWHSHLRKRLNLVPNPKVRQHARKTSNIDANSLTSSEMEVPHQNCDLKSSQHNLVSVGGSTETTAEFESSLLVQPYPLQALNTTGNFEGQPYREESFMVPDSMAWLQQPTFSRDNNPKNDFWISF